MEFQEWNGTVRITFRSGAFQLLSDTMIILNNEYSSGNRRPISYDSWNVMISIWHNGNMVFMFKKFHMYYNKYTWPKKKLVYLLCIRESNGRNHILVSRLHVSKQKKVALTETLSGKSFFPEPNLKMIPE